MYIREHLVFKIGVESARGSRTNKKFRNASSRKLCPWFSIAWKLNAFIYNYPSIPAGTVGFSSGAALEDWLRTAASPS